MTIENGYTADANEVRGSFKSLKEMEILNDYKDVANSYGIHIPIIVNTIYFKGITWAQTSTGMTTRNYEYYKGNNDVYVLKSYDIPLVSTNSKVTVIPQYYVFGLYDECDDSSVDGTKWIKISGASTATEDTVNLTIPNNHSYRTADLSSYKLIHLIAELYGNEADSKVEFYDGTNVVNLHTVHTIGEAISVSIRLDWANKKAYVTKTLNRGTINKPTTFSIISLSTLSTNLYLKFTNGVGAGGGNYLYIYGLRVGQASPSTTVTTSYSRNGTDFTTFTQDFGMSVSSGTTITVKATGTVASNEVLIFLGWIINEEIG
jgi:hypothetical protein